MGGPPITGIKVPIVKHVDLRNFELANHRPVESANQGPVRRGFEDLSDPRKPEDGVGFRPQRAGLGDTAARHVN